MRNDGRNTVQLGRGLEDVNDVIPCPQRHRVIKSTEGHVVICCTLLDSALGWWHAVTASMCVKCAAHNVVATDLKTKAVKWKKAPDAPTTKGDDPLSKHYAHMMLHPLRTSLPDDQLKRTLNFTRDETIERAKREEIEHHDILKALVTSVQTGNFDPKTALKIAERHRLIV